MLGSVEEVKRLRKVAVVLALLAPACGQDGGQSATPTSPTTVDTTAPSDPGASTTAPANTSRTTSPSGAGAVVPKTLAFTAAGVDGAQVVGADFAGKDVALWFWAPW